MRMRPHNSVSIESLNYRTKMSRDSKLLLIDLLLTLHSLTTAMDIAQLFCESKCFYIVVLIYYPITVSYPINLLPYYPVTVQQSWSHFHPINIMNWTLYQCQSCGQRMVQCYCWESLQILSTTWSCLSLIGRLTSDKAHRSQSHSHQRLQVKTVI